MFNYFKKRKEEKLRLENERLRVQEEQKKLTEKNKQLDQGRLKASEDSTTLVQLAKENTEINKLLGSNSGELIKLIEKYHEKGVMLLAKEASLSEKEGDLGEREKEIRKKEIHIEALNADSRRKHQDAERHFKEVEKRDKGLEGERENIKHREAEAKKAVNDARTTKEDMKDKKQKLEKEKEKVNAKAAKLDAQKQEVDILQNKMNAESQSIQKQQAELLDGKQKLEQEQREQEEKWQSIMQELNNKIAEYEGKIQKIEEYKNSVDSIKFDDSSEGKSAKITVQMAIREAEKMLKNTAFEFEQLNEKYYQGTFKGFSIPVAEIDKDFEQLRAYLVSRREHAENSPLPFLMDKIVNRIEEHLLSADKYIKSLDFMDAYKLICYGIAISESYELIIEIINDLFEEPSEEDESKGKDFPDYYEILGVPEDADEKTIKKEYSKLANEWHPDRHPDADEEKKQELEKKMQEINKAREVLLDKEKRKTYNKERKAYNEKRNRES